MYKDIPSIKANPEWIVPLLKIVDKYKGDIETRNFKINEFLEKVGRGRRKNPRASVYGVTLPSLKKLELTEGKGENKRINDYGLKLIDLNERHNATEFLKEFARHIYKIDKKWCNMIGAIKLLTESKNEVTSDGIINFMGSRRMIKTIGKDTQDRFKRWSKYLEYVKIISIRPSLRGKSKILLNLFQANAIEEGAAQINTTLFIKNLIDEYKKLKISKKRTSYIDIPTLRRCVCDSLKIWWWDFDNYFKKMPKITEDYNMVLSPPMGKERDGVDINGKYYYYVSIY